jgi:hypothetical protein
VGGFGLGDRAKIPVSGGSSLLFDRSHHAPKVGIEKLQVMELPLPVESSITSIMDEAFNCKFSAFGSCHSWGHGAHSHIESRDTAISAVMMYSNNNEQTNFLNVENLLS